MSFCASAVSPTLTLVGANANAKVTAHPITPESTSSSTSTTTASQTPLTSPNIHSKATDSASESPPPSPTSSEPISSVSQSNSSPTSSSSSTPQVCLHVRPPGYIRQAFGVPISNLGSGTGGSVTLHRHPWTGNQLAIKKFKFPPTMPSELRTRIVSSEAGIALPLSHPNIIKTYAYVHEQSASAGDYHFSRDDDGSYYCIMEAQPQDVFRVVQSNSQLQQQHAYRGFNLMGTVAADAASSSAQYISPAAMLTARYNKYFVQMVNAVHYLHTEKGIAHRDLKLDNFVLTHDDAVKLLDFGCATRLYPSLQYQQGQFKKVTGANVVKSTGVCGSDPYIAPEVLQCSGRNGAVGYDASKADVWSLAIIYLAMRSCHFPWNIALPAGNRTGLLSQRNSNSSLKKSVRELFNFSGGKDEVDSRAEKENKGLSRSLGYGKGSKDFTRFVRNPEKVIQHWLGGDKAGCGANALILKMLTLDPNERLSTAGILSDPWFKSIAL